MSIPPLAPPGVFPLGTHVYRFPHPNLDELLHDLSVIRRHGFTMIKVQEIWSADEPAPGEYQFETLDRILRRAAELDLGVYLGVTMEQAPAWFWRAHPDAAPVMANGHPYRDPTQYCLPWDGKPGPCWDHPGARQAGERFLAVLARRLARHTNIWVWNTWQEIGFWHQQPQTLPFGFCYCPHTIAQFQRWLRERYGDLRTLNAALRTAYADWDDVDPPRSETALPLFIDWRAFQENDLMVRALAWKTETLRAHDPLQRPIFSHVVAPRVGSGAEWRWAAVGDFFGNSNYPALGGAEPWDDAASLHATWPEAAHQELWEGIMLRTDLTRNINGADRPLWAAEMQGGPIAGHLQPGRVPDAADIRRWMLAGLAAGMTGLSFWNHRAEFFWNECNGFGLLDPQGETTERMSAAAAIGAALQTEAALFSEGAVPRASVALLVNDDLSHFMEAAAPQGERLYAYNLRGHYARLWHAGIPVDFVEVEEVLAGRLAEYPVALLPAPLALDPGYFAKLAEYVDAGGTLISEACPGRYDRMGMCPRSQMAPGGEELFGARHATVRIVREPDEPRWTPRERSFGEFAPATQLNGSSAYAGEALRASYYLQTLTPTTGAPVLLAGDAVAGVVNDYGRGRAYLLGTFAGMSATAHADPASDDFILRLLREAGVTPTRAGDLLLRRRVLGDREAWFFINPHGAPVSATVSLDTYRFVGALLEEDDVDVERRSLRLTVPAVNLTCVIVERA